MFFYVQLTEKVEVEPIYLDGKHEKGNVLKRTLEILEGKWILHYGFIVAICSIDHVDKGFINTMTYNFVYQVTFHAVVFRLIEGEITPAKFEAHVDGGMMFSIGPCYIFVPDCHIIQSQNEMERRKLFQKYNFYRLVILKYRMRDNKLSAIASLKDNNNIDGDDNNLLLFGEKIYSNPKKDKYL